MSFCRNDAGSDRVWRGARLVRSHGTRLGARWCEAEARQDDVSGYGAMPLLVVGFAQRVGAIRLDRASGRIGGAEGRSAGTDRGRRHLGCGRLAVEDCSPNHRPAVLARSVGTVLPGWVGFERDGAGGCAVVAPNLQLSPQGLAEKGRADGTKALFRCSAFGSNESMSRRMGGVDGGGRTSWKGSIWPGRDEVAPPSRAEHGRLRAFDR